MKQKINLRLIGIAVLAVLATTISLIFIYYNLFQKQVQDDLRINAEILKDTGLFDDVSGENDKELLDKRFTTDLQDLRITWVDEDGTVLYDNDNEAEKLTNHSDRPEIQSAFNKGSGESIRNSSTMNMDNFYYAIRLENGTVLRVAIEARNAFSVIATAFPIIIVILIGIIGVCILIAHYLTKQLIQPIEEMAANMEDTSNVKVYKELVPFMNTIRSQHENILSAAMSRQDFTANVSHELKTPLTAITGYAELIENHMVSGDRQSHFAGEIRKNSERLLSLINDIIRLSELDGQETAVHYENLDLYELTKECMGALEVNAYKRNITLSLEGESCMIRGNRDMLCELVDNLCQNGIRYNNAGGRVIVTATHQEGNPVLIVEDDGIGIPKDQQERVFERFYRVDKSRSKETGGTGLGLAIVKHIVALHNAELTLESEAGKGTKITVTF